jgi:hypothetical protein
VARNAGVFFVAGDDKTGVDPQSISVTLDGVEVDVTTSATLGGLAVQCAPAGILPPETEIEVELSVADRASPANVATRSYTFRTGSAAVTDEEAPLVSAVSPAPDASGVEARPTIEVRVRDAGLGVDFATLVMEVNGEAVPFTVEGTPSDARIRHRPASGFAPQSSVDVHVEACDGAPAANCSVLDFRFDVAAASASTLGRGAIVPDGYWANDPARPLEIRDIPRDWSVRIFDASGAAVRRHQNSAEGATWTWNFRNDEGGRVAPALYLVRVTDSNGAVQRSGRFLVQSQQ